MKNEKEIRKEMKRLGVKSEKQLLNVLRNMSESDVLFSNDSNIGVVVIGNRDIVGVNPSELLETSKKLQDKLDSKDAMLLSYAVDNEMFKSVKEKLDKDFSKKESEVYAKIKNSKDAITKRGKQL